ncbi:MAG: efflux RND transporter periplasmic adaptor subunit [Gemmataceae bacterium]|nr:efflux RND transporter periplasmic adaptor subunit [Gemmataceae bacterium]
MVIADFQMPWRGWLMLVSALLIGCKGSDVEFPTPPPPVVTVATPLVRDVIDTSEFTGRTAAVESVKVRARVFGHLQKIGFTEGAEVKKGDLLYVIDPRPFQATLSRAEAEFAQAEARLNRITADYGRAASLSSTRAISREEFEKVSFEQAEAKAAVRSSQAAVDTAKLNLEYSEVRAPINGQIGKTMVTVGNLIESGEMGGTLLTNIVSLTPMYVYFDVDDQTYIRIKPLFDASKRDSQGVGMPPIRLGIAGETGFPHQASIDFVDNQVDPGTGTLRMRAVSSNKDRRLTPGFFARVQVPLGTPHRAILVTERAVETDQGQKVLYVVGKDNIVEKRLVRLGRLHDGLREVLEGIQANDKVIINGLQLIRPGVPCDPKRVEMPELRDGRQIPTPAAAPNANGAPATKP